MAYCENEILRELNCEEEYTDRQLLIFAIENPDALVISKSCNGFIDLSTKRRKVLEIIKGYVHRGEHGTYYVPNDISRIYIVE